MKAIDGKGKTVRELLKGVKYSIDYYQREYKWQDKQIHELVDDLSDQFLESYQPEHERRRVADYPHYFLGSIIISRKDGADFVVDGQQRLTSLTLLLILLRHLQRGALEAVNVDELIVSEKYGEKSFNLDVPERTPCMAALFDGEPFDTADRPESVQNIVERYRDLEEYFPGELRGPALPFFVDWLLENVHLVEISAYSDEDAYRIFETMNDRGLSLSPTDMLKGYLLANIAEGPKRSAANDRWRDRVRALNDAGKEVEPDCFKAWLRSQYATKIRERRKGARQEDFDRIGTEFHRWLRDVSAQIGLHSSTEYFRFIDRDFDFYSRQYLRIVEASQKPVAGLEHIYYNAQHRFTLQNMVLLAPLLPDDPEEVVRRKLRIVARFIDILLARRLWNFRAIDHSTMLYAMFLVMRDVRRMEPASLAQHLGQELARDQETFSSNDRLRMHGQNRWYLHRLLARITDFVEMGSGNPSRYLDYVQDSGRNRFEVEHIWANMPDRHADEFAHPADFAEYRSRIGGLLLLPKSFNASYGALPYREKLEHYNAGQNLLARSLHPQCYDHNPGFLQFVERTGLPFHPHEEFRKADLDERSDLYRQIAEQVWLAQALLEEVGA